ESTLRFSVRSPAALHLRVAMTFSDAARYRITSYRPGEESRAVSLYRTVTSASEPLDKVWTPVTDGDTQVVIVERLGEAVPRWSIDVPLVSHYDRPLYGTGVTPQSFGDSAICQVDIACVYQVAPVAMQSGVV